LPILLVDLLAEIWRGQEKEDVQLNTTFENILPINVESFFNS
jgi:hypothetical protein